MLGLGQIELAHSANISAPTLRRMEASPGVLQGMTNNVAAVVRALEAAGVKFLDAGGVASGPGVSLERPIVAAIDVDEREVIQYPENLVNDAPPGAGG